MNRKPEYEGNRLTIRALELADGSCPVGMFLDGLDKADRRKLDSLFEMLGDLGRIPNSEKYKKLADSEEIWAFKSFQIRVLCFYSRDQQVLLAHALMKKKDKLNRSDIRIAEKRRAWYLSQDKK